MGDSIDPDSSFEWPTRYSCFKFRILTRTRSNYHANRSRTACRIIRKSLLHDYCHNVTVTRLSLREKLETLLLLFVYKMRSYESTAYDVKMSVASAATLDRK
jgi:hypothetical protein